jgi:hypothetical protein
MKLIEILSENIDNQNIHVLYKTIPKLLYHATYRALVNDILKDGLKICPNIRNFDWCQKGIYLASSPGIAESFAEVSENENIPEDWIDDIVVLEINTKLLDKNSFVKDPYWNIDVETLDETNLSFLYKKDIPPPAIKVTSFTTNESVPNFSALLPSKYPKDKLGSCMLAVEILTRKMLAQNINDFEVIEGWVIFKGYGTQSKSQHTWITYHGKVIDPTKEQFKTWGVDSKDIIYWKAKQRYSPEEYLKLCDKFPVKKIDESFKDSLKAMTLAALIGTGTTSTALPIQRVGLNTIKQTQSIVDQTIEDVIAKTLFHEAGNQPYEGKQAVASVLLKRARNNLANIKRVALARNQFSCWNDGSLPEGKGKSWEDCAAIARQMIDGEFVPTIDADHYYNPDICSPSWAIGQPFQTIGSHRFLKLGKWVSK